MFCVRPTHQSGTRVEVLSPPEPEPQVESFSPPVSTLFTGQGTALRDGPLPPPQPLPAEKEELILQKIRVLSGQREARKLLMRKRMLDQVSARVERALRSAAEALDSQINNLCVGIRGRLVAFQQSRREMDQSLRAEVNALQQDLRLLLEATRNRSVEIVKLGEAVAQNEQLFEADVAECIRILEEAL